MSLAQRLPARLPALVLAAAALILTSCNDTTKPNGPAPASALIVLNSLGETLDRVNLETGATQHNVAPVGTYPNELAVDEARGKLYVADSGSNAVGIHDLTSLASTGSIDLGVNSNPWGLSMAANGRLAISNWLAAEVATVDPSAPASPTRIPVGRTPQGVIHANGRLYVAIVNYDISTFSFGRGEVVAIADGRDTVTARAAVGINPQRCLIGPDGRLHVIESGPYAPPDGGRIRLLDATTLAVVDSIVTGGSPAMGAVVGSNVYLCGYYGGLLKYDGLTHHVLRGTANPVVAREGLSAVVADPGRNRLYVASFNEDAVLVIDTRADTLVTTWPVGDGPVALALAGSGQ